MKKILSLGLCLVLVLSLFPSTSFASTDGNEKELGITKEKLDYMENELVRHGVTEEVSKKLRNKMKNGELLDSIVMDESEAIDVTTKSYSDGSEEKIFTFPDGSISIVGVEHAKFKEGDINLMGSGIKGGKCTSGTGYVYCTNKKVYYNNPGTWEISFRANYSIPRDGFANIEKVYNQSVWVAFGTTGNEKLRVIKSNENSAGRAQARYSLYLYLGGSYGTLTRSVSLLVGKGAATGRGNNYY